MCWKVNVKIFIEYLKLFYDAPGCRGGIWKKNREPRSQKRLTCFLNRATASYDSVILIRCSYNQNKKQWNHLVLEIKTSNLPWLKTGMFYKIFYVTEHFLKDFGWFIKKFPCLNFACCYDTFQVSSKKFMKLGGFL